MTEDILALKPGTRLAHYVIEKVLGQGGFGIVYKAHHDHLNDPVVIKEFLPSELAGRSSSTVVAHSGSKQWLFEDCLQRFMNEGRVLVKLRHPNVVRCRDLFPDNGTAYLVMDYEDGLPLDELVSALEAQGEKYSEAQLMHFLIPLIDGLAHVHSQGVLHRDIKPANVFIRRSDGTPVLLDFGAAKQQFIQASQSQAPYTEFYAPLEQIAGEGEAQVTMDVHAFGALMYRLVTGRTGPKAETRAMKLSVGQDDPLIPAVQLAGGEYSAAFLEAIDACLAFRPEDRLQSMEALRERLTLERAPDALNLEPLGDLLAMAGADGVISEDEMSMLIAKAKELGMDAPAAQAYIVSHAHGQGWRLEAGSTQEKASQKKTSQKTSPQKKRPRSRNLTCRLQVTLEEVMNGATRNIDVTRNGVCERCKGDGADASRACEACQSTGLRQETVTLPVTVPAGVESGHRILLKGEGGLDSPGKAPGDIYVYFDCSPHELFERDGTHLNATVKLDKVLKPGEKFRFKSLDGILNVQVPDQFEYPGVIRITGRGFPEKRTGKRGDLFLDLRLPEGARQPAPGADHNGKPSPGPNVSKDKAENPSQDEAKPSNKKSPLLQAVAAAVLVALIGVGVWFAEYQPSSASPIDKLDLKFVDIPGGSFVMGSDNRDDNEKPPREVTVAEFKMMAHEVTKGQFAVFVEATGYRTDAERGAGGKRGCHVESSPGKDDWDNRDWANWKNVPYTPGDDHPVVCVSYNDAKAFIDWLSRETDQTYRLPSEAEWEYAARAGTDTKYSFGDREDQLCLHGNGADQSTKRVYSEWSANSCDDGYVYTSPVGRFRADNNGLHDMHGNVWEWTQDCWNESYEDAPGDAQAREIGNCDRRVNRGGSWRSVPWDLRSAERGYGVISGGSSNFGFRLVRDQGDLDKQTYGITVNTKPENARVRIMTIVPKYQPGIQVAPGNHVIEVSAKGYKTYERTHAVNNADLKLKVTLEKEANPMARLGMEFVDIPGGSFVMGSNNGRDYEKPPHKVTVPGFKMMKHEVTQGQFAAFVKATGFEAKGCYYHNSEGWQKDENRDWRNPGFDQGSRHPVACVSYQDAEAFADWLSRDTGKRYRLPSEAEWEYAARAGTDSEYSFGNREDQLCRYGNGADRSAKNKHGWDWANTSCDDGYFYTSPVGQFSHNDYGLYDMHGNVWEWTQDCWNDSYKGAPDNGQAWKSGDCDRRMLRGGAWNFTPENLRSTYRSWSSTDNRVYSYGFRLVQGR